MIKRLKLFFEITNNLIKNTFDLFRQNIKNIVFTKFRSCTILFFGRIFITLYIKKSIKVYFLKLRIYLFYNLRNKYALTYLIILDYHFRNKYGKRMFIYAYSIIILLFFLFYQLLEQESKGKGNDQRPQDVFALNSVMQGGGRDAYYQCQFSPFNIRIFFCNCHQLMLINPFNY